MELRRCQTPPWFSPTRDLLLNLHGRIANQYKVIHKVGYRFYGTVWLCRDVGASTPTYYAVKVLDEQYSEKDTLEAKLLEMFPEAEKLSQEHCICFPLRHFQLTHAQGSFETYVYPFLGREPGGRWDLRKSEDGVRKLRKMCFELTKALGFLHAHKIVHNGRSLA